MKPSKPPTIGYRDPTPLQDYYQDRHGHRYVVARLVDEAKGLKPFLLPLAGLDLSDVIWVDSTIYDLGWHVKKVNAADLKKPIILDWEGAIADGRHRVIKALSLGHKHILAVRLTWKLEPDRPANG